MRKKVRLPLPMLHPEGERILAEEVDLIYGMEKLPPRRRIDLITPEEQARIAEVVEANLAQVHGIGAMGYRVESFVKAPKLEVIGRPGSGVDGINLDAATAAGVAVVCTAGAGYITVAEHAVGR